MLPAVALRSAIRGVPRRAAAAAAGAALAGCSLLSAPAASPPGAPPTSAPAPSPFSAAATPSPHACPPGPAKFSCGMRARIAKVQAYLQHRPGVVGVVLRDRSTGAVWENRFAHTPVYMASTSKLAMAVTLLLQNQAGVIHLTPTDYAVLHQMLHVSSDTDADTLWFKFGAPFYTSYFPRIGLASAQYVSAPGITPPYWGEMICPATDLSRLITYVLDDMPAPPRDYLVNTLSHVAADQHFGVWGAGPANHPGNKDGWSVEQPGWIINSVGFAGPRQRYTLAVMNSLNGHGGYRAGTDTVTQVAAILFRGHQVQAPRVSATP
jgi:hypothetical protein